jgi:nickel/cobalt exporter
MSLVSAALLGLGLGVKHAFEADHVAAVCTLVARRGTVARAARFGALWGLGHGAVIILAGGALVAVGARVPGPLALALDAAVAVMLVGLGIAALRRSSIAPPQEQEHGHAHGHDQDHGGSSRRPILIGLVHGASGTAALTILVATTIPERAEAFAFITLFGLASVVGMAAAAAVLAWPLRQATEHAPAIARGLRGMAGVGSIAAGVMVGWVALMASSVG